VPFACTVIVATLPASTSACLCVSVSGLGGAGGNVFGGVESSEWVCLRVRACACAHACTEGALRHTTRY